MTATLKPKTMTREVMQVCMTAVNSAMEGVIAERDALLAEKAAGFPLDVQKAFAERDASREELAKVKASHDKLLHEFGKLTAERSERR